MDKKTDQRETPGTEQPENRRGNNSLLIAIIIAALVLQPSGREIRNLGKFFPDGIRQGKYRGSWDSGEACLWEIRHPTRDS